MTNLQDSLRTSHLSKLDKCELSLLTEAQRRRDTNRIADSYPDEGPLRRELYPKHIAFFKAGATHMERAAIAANRVGKTWGIGGYETALHLTGDYPPWWEGRRFDSPVDVWAAGDTGIIRIGIQKLFSGAKGAGVVTERPHHRFCGLPHGFIIVDNRDYRSFR